ncbi:MAG TPA: adenylate/guanylate cyclase domain-containing protein, partial [Herpetosiphonaceae bacterium]|nr:adenylate/guanylate cyclase domain-containing protein [Herpetosiphonaceae bacterium]
MHRQWQAYLPHYVTVDLATHPGESPVGRQQRFAVVALFADIAGFTALSEALGQEGRSGTEQLTTILNQCFAPLIDIIHQHGGVISTFSGDALTVLFALGDGAAAAAARRAAHCALSMQAIMDDFAMVRTAVGPWSLTLKIGLAAGSVLYTTVGDPAVRTVAIVGGAVLDQCSAAQSMAEAGEIIVHRPSLPDLEGLIDADPADDRFGRLLRQPSEVAFEPVAALDLLPEQTIETMAAYLHPSIAGRLREGQATFINERRPVTVLFINFDHFDYDHDPEVGAKLQDYFANVLRAIERYGGYLNKVEIGDKGSSYLVLFGAPVAHENDIERANHCALDLRDLDAVEARIGINTGFVFSGLIGSPARQ